MASQVAPGYNPEVSLLQGGTAPIVPVQGGGGMEAGSTGPQGYNYTESLLNTPQTPPTKIMAISGGALETVEETAFANYVLEFYDPPLSMIPIPPLPEQKVRRDKINEYVQLSVDLTKHVESLERAPTNFTDRGDVAPTFQKCTTEGGKRKLPFNFFSLVRKRIVLIDEPNPHIWIIPNLRGNVSKFIQYMKLVPKDSSGKILSNHFVMFTGAFFSEVPGNENLNLYHQFLSQKIISKDVNNINNLFYLNTLNDNFVNIACEIVRSVYAPDTLKTREGGETPLSVFFEPDIVMFTKPKIIFKNSEFPVQRNDNRVKVSTLLKRSDFTSKSFIIIPSPTLFDKFPSSEDTNVNKTEQYFSFSFNPSVVREIKRPSKSDILCPKEQICSGFQGGYKLVQFPDDRRIDNPGVYLLYKNTDKMPFLKDAGSKLSPEELRTLEEKKGLPPPPPPPPAKTGPDILPLTEEKEEVTKKGSLVLPAASSVEVKEEPFVASTKAVKAEERVITVQYEEFRIRIPYEKGVREDWNSAVFSKNEVELLNALQFTPSLLGDAIGKGEWKQRLAEFLESLVVTDCFKHSTLLTKLECSNGQEFMKRIYLELYNRLLSKLYDESGVPKPATFASLLALLQKIQFLGPTTGMLTISKNDFSGDLLNRFQLIQKNAKTGEYVTDFAEMSQATRDILAKMKLYRYKDMNYDQITKLILTKMGQAPPPPPSPPQPPLNLAQLYSNIQVPKDLFTKITVSGDGLCFYRAILKSLDPNAQPDSAGYIPDVDTSIQFIEQIRDELSSGRIEYKERDIRTGNVLRSMPIAQHFNETFAAKPNEPEVLELKGALISCPPDRIRRGTFCYKFTFANFLKIMADKTNTPWAEVNDAAIGEAAAKLKNVLILLYDEMADTNNYVLQGVYNRDAFKGPTIPFSQVVFLVWTMRDHYDVLRLKPGKTFPAAQAGGGDEIIDLGDPIQDGGEILDLGEPVKRKYRKETRRNRKVSRHFSRRHAAPARGNHQ